MVAAAVALHLVRVNLVGFLSFLGLVIDSTYEILCLLLHNVYIVLIKMLKQDLFGVLIDGVDGVHDSLHAVDLEELHV